MKRKARWKHFTRWLRLVLKPGSKRTSLKDNRSKVISSGPAAESLRNVDPLLATLCEMLDEAARTFQAELRAVVRSVRQALRRSPSYYRVSLEEAVENPQKVTDVLRLFIRKNSTLRKHLKLEYESPDVQQSTRNEKFRRALVLQEDGGDSIRSNDEEYKRAESPNLGATTSSNYGKTKPVIPDLTTAAANGKGPVAGVTIDSKGAADAPSGHVESLCKGVSADATELVSRPGIQISVPAAPCSGTGGEGLQGGSPKPARLIPDEEIIFGVALFLSRSKVASGSWDDLIGQSRSMMSASRPLISGQSSSSETVTFERIIEESCPGEQWKLGIDDIKYSALWILMAVEKVRGNQNDVRHLLNEGLNLAWKRVNSK